MRHFKHILASTALLAPAAALAVGETMSISSFGAGGSYTMENVIGNITETLATTIEIVCVTVFVAGALLFIVSAGNEQRKTLGKDMMISAVIGFAVVVGAQGIMNMVLFFIYGTPPPPP